MESADIENGLKLAQAGKVDFRNNTEGNILVPLGKLSFSEDQFVANLDSFMKTISDKRPEKFKGKLYKAAYLKSTVGQNVRMHVPLLDPKSDLYFMRHLEKYQNFMLA